MWRISRVARQQCWSFDATCHISKDKLIPRNFLSTKCRPWHLSLIYHIVRRKFVHQNDSSWLIFKGSILKKNIIILIMHVQDVRRVPIENWNSLMFCAGGQWALYHIFIIFIGKTRNFHFYNSFGGGDNFGIVRANATSMLL